jgi:hypothetical protein
LDSLPGAKPTIQGIRLRLGNMAIERQGGHGNMADMENMEDMVDGDKT